MDFDRVLVEIGEFGKYQITNYFLICLPVMFGAANSLSYVFTAGIPNYRCLIPECDDPDHPEYEVNWMQNAVPGSTDVQGVFTPEQCDRFYPRGNATLAGTCPKDLFLTNRTLGCDQWVFDNSEKTIVQEWLITCTENAWKLALVGTMHFAGLVVGTAASGFLADRYGRKLVFVACIIFMSLTGILQGLAWDYNSFLIFAFLNAVGTSGVYPLAFIIGVEMVGPRKREMCSILLNYFYAIGEALVGLSAWICRDWKILQFGLSIPPILFVLYYWIVPESVRWLIVKEEHEKAKSIIKKAAKVNGKVLSEALLATFEKPPNDIIQSIEIEKDSSLIVDSSVEDSRKYEIRRTVVLMLKSKTLLGRIIVLLYLWAVNSFVYYGLSLNSTNLSGNKYINFALVCLVEIPGYSLAWFLMNKAGRRWSSAGSLFLCAVTCVAGGFITKGLDKNIPLLQGSFCLVLFLLMHAFNFLAPLAYKVGMTWAIVSLFLIGKLGITASFGVIYAHTAEMMPTVIRSGGVGCMSTVARCGAMLAPFVPILGIYFKPLPLLIFGVVSLTGSFLALLLPETLGQKLPDTVEEAERIGKSDELLK